MPEVRKGNKRWLIAAIVVISVVTLVMIVTAVFLAVDGLRYRNYTENVPAWYKLKPV